MVGGVRKVSCCQHRKKKGDDDDEVINTESSDRAERPDDCRGTAPTTKKIEKIVEVHHCKVGNPNHRHGQLEVLPWISAVFTKSAD